jgi:hypothetical protein
MGNNTKPWWASKTIWANLLAVIGSIVVGQYVDTGTWAEVSTVLLAVVNLVLRVATNSPLGLTAEEK